MVILQNEQRVLHDVGIQIMIYLATVFGVPPESVQITWNLDGTKWLPSITLAQTPAGRTPEEVREEIVGMYRRVRTEIAKKFVQNRVTRFHSRD